MTSQALITRSLIVWLVIIFLEFLHGFARAIFLEPYVGDLRARQIGVIIGSLLILAIAFAFSRWISATSRKQLLAVGILWVGLTLVFEIIFGRFVMELSWERLLSDYNPLQGGFLALGIIVLLLSPLAAAKLRRIKEHDPSPPGSDLARWAGASSGGNMYIPTHRRISFVGQVGWLLATLTVGFTVSAFFAGVLRLPRNLFLLPYSLVAIGFLQAYLHFSGVDLSAHYRKNPIIGILAATLAGILVVMNVVSQPASPAPDGLDLFFALLWAGIVYGLLDALLLSVIPVIAMWLAFTHKGLTRTQSGRLIAAVLALAASLAVTAAYHLGYPEFRGPQVIGPVIGNGILTIAYLLTRSPLAPTLGHIAMHVAAVLHGMETTLQLPPHY
ncbi:MAG TPA: hypothetical protein VKZ59_07835 [Acidobacteriota bacterium]|nr:hypothetical protein [Acidobacteriota bacterium]